MRLKDEGVNEGVIEQINHLFREQLLEENPELDEENRIRLDTVETNDHIQGLIKQAWDKVDNDNFAELGDYKGYNQDFLRLFGFGFDDVDYDEDVNPVVEWE